MGLSFVAIQQSRKSSRDAKRKADLELIRAGVELYRADCNTYPPNNQVDAGDKLIGDNTPTSCASTNTYIEEVPDDPINGYNYDYVVGTGSLTYTLCTALESSTTLDAKCNSAGANCGTGVCSYSVVNP